MNSILLDHVSENPDDVPECKDIGWLQSRVKLYRFGDLKSTQIFSKILTMAGEVWPGANLALVELSEIPNRPKGALQVPENFEDPEKIIKLLKICNKNLNTEEWKVAKVYPPENGFRKVIIILNNEALNVAKNNALSIKFGFGEYTMRIYKTNGAQLSTANSPVGEDNTEKAVKDVDVKNTNIPGSTSTNKTTNEGTEPSTVVVENAPLNEETYDSDETASISSLGSTIRDLETFNMGTEESAEEVLDVTVVERMVDEDPSNQHPPL